jgi:hypothetical protein
MILYQFFFKFKIRGLCNRIYERIDLESIGKNIALKLLKNTDKALIFTDTWNINKKIQNNFLLYMKGKATIISTNHTPYHFTFQKPIEETPVQQRHRLFCSAPRRHRWSWRAWCHGSSYRQGKGVLSNLHLSQCGKEVAF